MKERSTLFQRIENMHPYQTLMFLGMFGSGLVFLFMLLAFLGSQATYSLLGLKVIPKFFVASTFFLLVSSYSVSKLASAFDRSETRKLVNTLTEILILGFVFSVLQVFGWMELTDKNITFDGLPSGSFLYVLSGIHLVHLAGAMAFAVALLREVKTCERDEVKELIMFANPYAKMKFKLFALYWRFMDLVWLVLFFSFLLVT